jgi:hypothetical protein
MQRVKKMAALFGIALSVLVGCSTLLQPSASAHGYRDGGWRGRPSYGYGGWRGNSGWRGNPGYNRYPRYRQAYAGGGFFGGNRYRRDWHDNRRGGWGSDPWGGRRGYHDHDHHHRW